MSSLVITEAAGNDGIATLTLNRPEARNPTSIAMLDAMDEGLDAVESSGAARVLIIGGAGRAFCAGLDLDEVVADTATIHALLRRLSEVMRRIRRLPIATIARVQGAAIGGGFGFMAVTDFAITHAEAKIGYPPLETCLSPALMAPWLIRKIGPSRARSMLIAGGVISGRDAFDVGLVTSLVERDALPETARRLAEDLARGGRDAMTRMKTLLNELDGSIDDEMLDHAALVSAEVIAGPEAQEQLRAMRARGGPGQSAT